MGKVFFRYFLFWLPAFAVATFYNNDSIKSQVLQWFLAFFMILAWGINTGTFSYYYPRACAVFLLLFGGVHILLINIVYRSVGSLRDVLRQISGFFTFRPLDIFVVTLRPYNNVPHEQVVILILTGACVLGWLVGLVHRRVNPNPYSPRIMRNPR